MEILKIWEILLRKKKVFLCVFLGFFVAVLFVTHLSRPIYNGQVKVLIKTGSDPMASLLGALGLKSTSNTSTSTSGEYDTDIEMGKVRPILEKIVGDLGLKAKNGSPLPPETLMKAGFLRKTISPGPFIEIDQQGDASMLKIDAYSADREEAARLANTFAELYIGERSEKTKEEYAAARAMVEGRIAQARDDYYRKLKEFKDYRLSEGFVDLDAETADLLEKVTSLVNAYEENEKAIFSLEKKIAFNKQKLAEVEKFRKSSETYSENEIVNNLKTSLNEVLVQVASKSVDITTEHPTYKSTEKQIEAIRDLMRQEARRTLNTETITIDPMYDEVYGQIFSSYVEREVDIALRKVVQSYIDQYRGKLQKVTEWGTEMTKISADASVYESLYKSMFGYLNQVSMAENIALSNISVVQKAAIPAKAYFPKKALNYALGLVLGFFFGLVAALIVDYVDTTVKTPEDVKQATGMHFFGGVPYSRLLKTTPTVAGMDESLPEVDAFRAIKNGISLSSGVARPGVVAVASVYRGEGKSTVASNAAIMFAREGKRTLLVDLNVLAPAARKFFVSIDDSSGIADVMAGRKEMKDVIQRSAVGGLDVAPLGASYSGGPLSIDKLSTALDGLRASYDVVMLDMPPIGLYNDAVVFGKAADGVVLVVESGRVPMKVAAHIKEVFDRASVKVLGVVLNRLKLY